MIQNNWLNEEVYYTGRKDFQVNYLSKYYTKVKSSQKSIIQQSQEVEVVI